MLILSRRRFAVSAGASLLAQGTAEAQPRKQVAMGLSSSSFATSGPRVADQLGLFDKYGLSGKFIILDGSTAAISGLMAGSLGLIIVGMPDFVAAYARNDNVVAIGSVYDGYGTSLVISKALADKSGVSPSAPLGDRLKVLEGRTIASVAPASAGTAPFKAAFKAFGVNVTMTYMSQAAMQAALEKRVIDGYTASAPFWAFPVVDGSAVLWIDGPKRQLPAVTTPGITGIMLTTRQYAAANPEVIRDLRAMLADLATAVRQRPKDVEAAVGKLYPELPPETLDALFAAEANGWNTAPLTPQGVAQEVAVFKAIGLPVPAAGSFDPAAMIAP